MKKTASKLPKARKIRVAMIGARGISGFADPNTSAVIYADATLRSGLGDLLLPHGLLRNLRNG